MIRTVYARLRPIWLTIRCSSLAFRQRHRLIWCACCERRMPDDLSGMLVRAEMPRRARVARVVWLCMGCSTE